MDTRDRTDIQTTYVVEENMDVITDSHIEHPEVEAYFVSFDRDQYTPRPWLKELYPKDWLIGKGNLLTAFEGDGELMH